MGDRRRIRRSTRLRLPAPAGDNAGTETEEQVVPDLTRRSMVDKDGSLFRMLPENIWLKIFQDVEDKKDWESGCLASSHIDKSLSSTKALWRFKKAVSSIEKFLPFDELLSCRLVCKQWKEDIDTHLQSKPNYPSTKGRGFYNFTSTAKLREFLQTFSDHPGNPLVGRTVHISNEGSERSFSRTLEAFMNRFGDQVWNLRMSNNVSRMCQLHNLLHLVLTRTTNLKHLRFSGEALDYLLDDTDTDIDTVVSASILNRPLPFVPTLESLWFEVMYCGHNLHSLVMLPYAIQLRSLQINMRSWRDFYARGLLNLKELVLYDIPSDEFLEKLLQLNAPIETISLGFGERFPSRVSLALVMKVLSKFPLREVALLFGEEGWMDEPEESEDAYVRIRLPKVKKLYVSQANKFSYNFLKCFTNLERLTVEVEGFLGGYTGELGQEQETDEDVQFYKMLEKVEENEEPEMSEKEAKEGNVYESNIWKKLPKLKSVHVFDSAYNYGKNAPFKRFNVKGNRAQYDKGKRDQWLIMISSTMLTQEFSSLC